MKFTVKHQPLSLILVLAMVFSMMPTPVFAADSTALADHIVINQAYGCGGNSGAAYKNDFVELYNPTDSDISLDGWSIQYAAKDKSSYSVTALSGSIKAKGYYLLQLKAGNGGTLNLPTPDATGSTNMSATDFKLALVSSTTAISSKSDSGVVDFLGTGAATE